MMTIHVVEAPRLDGECGRVSVLRRVRVRIRSRVPERDALSIKNMAFSRRAPPRYQHAFEEDDKI